MRITGGEFRGRRLLPPDNEEIRPTSDKVRQAVFNILNARGLVREAVVLDAFCGTGALGLEALSQGAHFCTFTDKSPVSLGLCKKNAAILGTQQKSAFYKLDMSRPGLKPQDVFPASLVFLDPPYHKGLVETALASLHENGWLDQNANVLVEAEKGFDAGAIAAMGYDVLLTRDYGDTRIVLAESQNNS